MNRQTVIKVYGKWILSGEYSVLKGCPALAFPLPSHFVELRWNPGQNSGLIFKREEEHSTVPSAFVSAFENILDQALQKISKTRTHLNGEISLKCCILMGAGMGASAVMCVLIGRLFQHLKWVQEDKLFSFCHSLENIVHGESSGLDVAVVLKNKPVFYRIMKFSKESLMNKKNDETLFSQNRTDSLTPEIQTFSPAWQPWIFLSHSGSSSLTQKYIQKMKVFQEDQPLLAEELDQLMKESVFKAKEALENKNQKEGLKQMSQSFRCAEECFFKWNLISEQMKQQMDFLKQNGALAVKPTGSGAGGCLLSLWNRKPPPLKVPLISAF